MKSKGLILVNTGNGNPDEDKQMMCEAWELGREKIAPQKPEIRFKRCIVELPRELLQGQPVFAGTHCIRRREPYCPILPRNRLKE